MVRAACHCGAARITQEPAPTWVCDCNCSICRRYGALWAYTWDFKTGRTHPAKLLTGEGDLEAYVWGDRTLAFWRCRHCGCITHHTAIGQPATIRGVNARLFVDFDPATVVLNRSDNAHTGYFWTRPDQPIWEGPQEPMPPPGPDDWR